MEGTPIYLRDLNENLKQAELNWLKENKPGLYRQAEKGNDIQVGIFLKEYKLAD